MISEKAFWLWLQHGFGAGSVKPVSVGRRFDDIGEFFEGGKTLWAQFDFIRDREIEALSGFSPQDAMAQIEYCEKIGQKIYTYVDDEYPEKLRNISCPPAVLFVKGQMPDFDNILTISVVGSRKANESAVKMTELISYELSKEGVIVVSGGALGIDTAAHKGAMRAFAPTAALLACGIDYPYLMQNARMRNSIVEKGGALISEYPMNMPVNKGNFVVRNRIVSGLCNGLLVSQSAEKGGTMLTVKHAVDQNKDLFAFMGDTADPNSVGSNRLIRDGAVPVFSVNDILDEYKHLAEKRIGKKDILDMIVESDPDVPKGISTAAAVVFGVLKKEPVHVSYICEMTGLKISQVLAAVTELELTDNAKTYSGQRCSLC